MPNSKLVVWCKGAFRELFGSRQIARHDTNEWVHTVIQRATESKSILNTTETIDGVLFMKELVFDKDQTLIEMHYIRADKRKG